jgi:hypothetical protein
MPLPTSQWGQRARGAGHAEPDLLKSGPIKFDGAGADGRGHT